MYASGALATAALLTLPGVRRYFYELFLCLHVVATGAAAIAVWHYLSIRQSQARFYVLGGLGFWVSWFLIELFIDLLYNINFGRGNWLPKGKITTVYRTESGEQVVMSGVCHLEIDVHHHWNVRPGQYLFVTFPGFGLPSTFQRHPFWIVWWETDPVRKVTKLDLLVRKRNGFTRRLLSHRDDEYVTWVSRPFGRSENFGDYGSILMLATDIGIAAHLPYLKTLMQGRLEASIRTKRVVVVWQVKDSSKTFAPVDCRPL